MLEPLDASIGTLELWIRIIQRPTRIDAVDPSVLPVPVVIDMSIPGSPFVMRPKRIVIADGVVPIRDPDRAIRTDLRGHRCGPGIGGGVKIALKARGAE